MCCGGKPLVPVKINETLSNSFSVAPSADVSTFQDKSKLVKSKLTREDFLAMNFANKKIKQ